MSIWLGIVKTIIDNQPKLLTVGCSESKEDLKDPVDSYPFNYIFRDAKNTQEQETLEFVVRVKDVLAETGFNNQMDMHNNAIKFGLYSIRNNPNQKEFVFDSEKHDGLNKILLIESDKLKHEILRFIYTINSNHPDEGISHYDLMDNYSNTDKEINSWLRFYEERKFLVRKRRSELFRMNRGQVNTQPFKINPEKIEDVKKELGIEDLDDKLIELIDPSNHPIFHLVETQAEKSGKFAFVIMPLNEDEFPQDILPEVFQPAVKDVFDYTCHRSDTDKRKNYIESKIFSLIVKSEIVIAELSTENRNVVLEFGMALALGKDIIPVCDKKHFKSKRKLAFDYEHFDTIFYDEYDDLKIKLEEALTALKVE
ncbi:MAG: hypothetical protein V3V99_08390 [candidate division Zixibacteria bacterium]